MNKLGIDIGRVIINGPAHPQGGDTAFFTGDEATLIATPEMEGAFEVIARLTKAFNGQAWLVSKCGPRVQARTLRWLQAHDFYQRTSIPAGNVRFCRQRIDKREHCLDLGLSHFIDDHPEVHAAIRGAVTYQYFFGPQRNPVPGWAIHAPTWADAERQILASIEGTATSDGFDLTPCTGVGAGSRTPDAVSGLRQTGFAHCVASRQRALPEERLEA